VRSNARPDDLLVAPGGRNGALVTARISKLSVLAGSTFVVAADRESVLAGDGIGIVGSSKTREYAS
jgi:hypothetical protein